MTKRLRRIPSVPARRLVDLSWQAVLVVAGLTVPAAGATTDEADDPSAEEPSLLSDFMDWVDEQHGELSEKVADSALAIDRFFATEEYLEDTTNSYLQVITELGYDTRDAFSGDLKVRGKLDLPGTKRRFSLLITGESDDPLTDAADLDDTGGQGSIALERNPRDGLAGWQIRPGLGVKGGWPPDPFAQVRATRYDDFGDGWLVRTQASARYLVDDQWDLRGEFNLSRVIDYRWSWRARTDVRWEDVDGYTKASQSFDLYQRVSDHEGFRHTLSVSGNNEDKWAVDSYGYRFSWRKLIHSDWLYFEVSPEVYFSRDEDYEPAAALLLRLEAFAGDY